MGTCSYYITGWNKNTELADWKSFPPRTLNTPPESFVPLLQNKLQAFSSSCQSEYGLVATWRRLDDDDGHIHHFFCSSWWSLPFFRLEGHLRQHFSTWHSSTGTFSFFQHQQHGGQLLLLLFDRWSCFTFYPYTQGILVNGQYPGPDIYSVTNDNLIINVHNDLDEPFLLSW